MKGKGIKLEAVFKKKEGFVEKEIEDELVLIVTQNGISDIDSSIYTLNETGKVIWQQINGEKSVNDIIVYLSTVYDAPTQKIQKETQTILEEFVFKKMIYEI